MLRTGPWHPGSQLSTASPELRQAWALIRNTRPPPPAPRPLSQTSTQPRRWVCITPGDELGCVLIVGNRKQWLSLKDGCLHARTQRRRGGERG